MLLLHGRILPFLVGFPGFEPGLDGSKPPVLPLHQRPMLERPPGFEPGISTMARWRDSQLRYGRILGAKASNLYFQIQNLACYRYTSPHRLAPPPGLEPGTIRLTAGRSTN